MLSSTSARRGAIHLNNCAVILLSRHLWTEAMDTFKDAIRIMTIAADEPGRAIMSEPEMNMALHRAWQRTSIALPKTNTDTRQGPMLKVISTQFNPAAVFSTLSSSSSPQGIKLIATIDPIDLEDWHSDATDLESSVILYNFGVAHSCLGSVSSCGFFKAKLQAASASEALASMLQSHQHVDSQPSHSPTLSPSPPPSLCTYLC